MIRKLLARLQGRGGAPVPNLPPEVPAGVIIYAIGDIHGEAALLENLLDRLRRDAAGRDVRPIAVFLGDYVDRGPDSQAVVDILRAPPLPGFTVDCLMGNHERELLNFLTNPLTGAGWLEFGGMATLNSYNVRIPPGVVDAARLNDMHRQFTALFPATHRQLLETLPLQAVHGDYLFVHAGIRPGLPLAAQQESDLLWIREPFLSWPDRHEKVVVHGHTIRPTPQILPHRIGIDTGAYASGVLTAVALEGQEVRIIQARRER